jgi:predicted acylesterase/phospholipase RssA
MENRPKVGVALSGASGRAIAHVAVLEVLRENNIPIDYIVGCSSGGLIAVSYAAGTMDYLKDWLFKATFRRLYSLWSTKDAKGGMFHLHNADEELLKITKGLSFEQLNPKVGLTATDINTAELVNITSGDLLPAIKATIAVPGLFEPAVINGRVLVDGGLVNIVPTHPTREMGADIVIGVNLAATKFIYEKKMPIWRGFRFITRLLGLQFIREKILPMLSPRVLFRIDSQSDILEEEDIKIPGMITMLAKAIDHSFEVEKQWTEAEIACDWMIEPRVKHYGKTEFESLRQIYDEGRRAAQLAVPHIKKLIESKGPGKLERIGEELTRMVK